MCDLLDRVSDMSAEAWDSIQSQREEVLKAFLAKHGVEPDEVEQVVIISDRGIRWSLRRKVDCYGF